MSITWKEPPPDARLRHRIDDIVDELKARPGEWGLCYEGVASAFGTKLKKHGCEATTRVHRDEDGKAVSGKHDIYARWPVT